MTEAGTGATMSGSLGVAHVHWAFLPTTGGTESHLADIVRRQVAAGLRVSVLTGEPQPTAVDGCTVESSPLLNLDALRARPPGEEAALRDEVTSLLADFIARQDVDVVHGHNLHHFFPEPALVLDELRRTSRFRVHHTFHETWPDMLAATPVYRDWDGNYAISAHVQSECEQRLGFRPELLRNPVDTDVFVADRPPFSDSSAVAVVLHPARLLPWKGVHVTIRAIEQLRKSSIRVKLLLTDTQRICDWDDQLQTYRQQMLHLIAELGLERDVEFVSAAYSDMAELYRRADIVVYPTVGEEPLGLVPLEAMSCARPVVATRSGGIPESVVDGVTGCLVERGDVDGLAEAVAALIAHPARAREMGAAGSEWVRRHHAIDQYVDELTDRYRVSVAR